MIGGAGDGHKSKCIPKYDRTRMDTTDKGHTGRNRTHKPAPATEAKYRPAIRLFRNAWMSGTNQENRNRKDN